MDASDLVNDADLEGQPIGLQLIRSFEQQEAAKLLAKHRRWAAGALPVTQASASVGLLP